MNIRLTDSLDGMRVLERRGMVIKVDLLDASVFCFTAFPQISKKRLDERGFVQNKSPLKDLSMHSRRFPRLLGNEKLLNKGWESDQAHLLRFSEPPIERRFAETGLILPRFRTL